MSSPSRNPPWLRRGASALALGWLLSCQVDKLFRDGGASDPPAARLEFTPPPNATAGDPLSPAVRVSAIDSTGSVDSAFHGTVTLTLGEHPEGAALRGTRTLDAVRGVTNFADLSVNRAGTGYTLVATATGVRGATSPGFDVAPAAAARLAFSAQPHNAMVDSVTKPAVQVTVFDTLGNVATSFAGEVTVALAANSSGGALGGTRTAPAASGVATFADLSVNRPGTGYRLTASAGQLSGATSDAFDITAGPPTTGDLTVNATTTGDNAPGSYTVTVDGGLSRTIGANGAGTTYNGLPASDHVVALTDVPANCTVSGGASKTVTVPAGGAATAAFTISCTALTGSLTVSTTTTGANLDPDGYTFAVDGGTPQPIGINATIPLTGVAAGSHAVALTGVAANCTVSGGASLSVTVPPGGTATAAFAVSCAALTGDLAVKTSTSGAIPPSPYSVTVDGGSSKSIGPSDSVTYSGIAAANHSVRLNDVPANCSVNGLNPRMVTVPAGGAVEASFTITCQALTGSLTVSTSTSGPNAPSSYTFSLDGGASQNIGASASVTVSGLATGSHTVQLGGVPTNCSVSGGTSQTVTVSAGGTAQASFTITCQALTGSLTVSTSTSGPNAPSGYTFSLDGGASQNIGASASVTVSGLAAGSHTVQLGAVPTNCSVSGGTSQTVTVSAGGTAQASFTITCQALTGSLTVSTSTSGANAPSAYTFSLDGGASQNIGASASVTVSGLATGSHTVQLGAVPTNCSVSGGTSQTVTVPAGGSTQASFSITCTAPNQPPVVSAGPDQSVLIGALFNLSGASFTDPDHNGPWTVTIDWGDSSSPTTFTASEGSISKSHSYATVLPATYTLTVTVTDAGGLSGSASKTVKVGTL